MNTKHTPGPWPIGEFEPNGGYDCMTCGIQVGPIRLDGADYGQEHCEEPTEEQVAQMYADAKLIASAPELLEALERLMIIYCPLTGAPTHDELVEHWEYEKSEGNGAADDMLFVLSVIKKATE